MNLICSMLSRSAMSPLLCHVQRSETSLEATRHHAAANDLRFFFPRLPDQNDNTMWF